MSALKFCYQCELTTELSACMAALRGGSKHLPGPECPFVLIDQLRTELATVKNKSKRYHTIIVQAIEMLSAIPYMHNASFDGPVSNVKNMLFDNRMRINRGQEPLTPPTETPDTPQEDK